MALKTFPLDLFAGGFPGTTTRFELGYVQELSPSRGGVQNAADLGPPLWETDVQSRLLRPLDLRRWKARLATLEGGINTFVGYDLTACFPVVYPAGSWPTGLSFDGIADLDTVDTATYKQIKLGGLPVGYLVSEGDYLSFTDGAGARCLHQALAAATAGGDGKTPYFEVRPHIRLGYASTDSPPAMPEVALVKPHAVMVLIPDSVSQQSGLNGWGSISFSARQTL